MGADSMKAAIRQALDGAPLHTLHASRLATDLTGDSIATNILMVGYAAQLGLLPVSVASLEEAIRLNGSFVKANLRTFALGRVAAHAPDALAREFAAKAAIPPLDTVDAVLASRTRLLAGYQDTAYADRYTAFVRSIEARAAMRNIAGVEIFVREVALTLARLMAYKDEYEVARLHADPVFWQRLHEQFAADFKVSFHLAPPMLPGRDASGRPRKRTFGPWMLPVFKLLRHGKRLRGTALDPFGYTAERRLERRLIADYRRLIEQLVDRLESRNLDAAIELAGAAYDIRGYGPVKHASVQDYLNRHEKLLAAFEAQSAASKGEKQQEAVLF
jgi:indolepyruvate ferredoxin oxidoreductase